MDILKITGDISNNAVPINREDLVDEDNLEQLINNMIDIPKTDPVSEENILIEILPRCSKTIDSSVKDRFSEEKMFFQNDGNVDNEEQYECLSNTDIINESSDIKPKMNYYDKKLILLARIARAKERSADAKERIAQALENISECKSQIF